jgi:hypothetical protein
VKLWSIREGAPVEAPAGDVAEPSPVS